ncbi:FAD-dependent oxidoreductase [Streptomyces sp. H10-C2]|uniref:NAD(P)/FAD-dependent oxidoreductase n=1 Tax=unclassified Streptomyces TaxID=2593676 RepID=UPI0024BBB308|nr:MULTISPECIES: FAD-dependent oxidoreductase [unclassified Streptomyces]MDJ0341007.1 FAD-dependent oxidoreductase [Streptomyces sp. PH10-H1]MDJ0369761.1 FAD-dependent oxidoreductase [Streptomyces sp. H10-C2]
MKTVAVVGASLAGLSAARSLRKQGYDGRLVVIGDEPHRPYDRPPLSKEFLAGEIDEAALMLEADGEDLAAEWVLGATAVGLDRGERSVRLADGRSVTADGIVVATGAAARTLPGSDGLAGVHVLRTVEDACALRADLARGGRLVVIGGGFIGAEVASTASGLGLDVTVVEAASTPLAGPLGAAMGGVVSSLHMDHGVRLLCGVGVRQLSGRGRVDAIVLEDGRRLAADVVVVGVGARPCVEWLQGSGVALGNGVRCDAGGSTTVPGVVAVGDCAAWYDPTVGAHRRVEHWTGARERPAAAVAALLSGGTAAPEPVRPPYFWSDQYGIRIQFAGHAADADSVTVEEGSVDGRSFLAVYRRAGDPVAVLGMDQARLFTRWRRQLVAAAAQTAGSA